MTPSGLAGMPRGALCGRSASTDPELPPGLLCTDGRNELPPPDEQTPGYRSGMVAAPVDRCDGSARRLVDAVLVVCSCTCHGMPKPVSPRNPQWGTR